MSSVDSRAARLLSSQGQAEWDPISPEYYAPASGLGNAGLAGLGALRGPMVFPTLRAAKIYPWTHGTFRLRHGLRDGLRENEFELPVSVLS